MEIQFRRAKLAKLCNSGMECRRKWGPQTGKLVQRRLEELASVETLADLARLPQTRLHTLRADRRGQFAVDVGNGMRLVFEPSTVPPREPGGGIDLSQVTEVRILEVVNYHG